jgi:hypothetical protein
MLSRREFLGGVSGLLAVRGPGASEEGTSAHKRERPAESMQQLIQQIRFLEQNSRSKEHVQAIQDQIRVRLLLTGLACIYMEENGQHCICALETKTGSLWCLPVSQSSSSWARLEWRKIGLEGLENRIEDLPFAWDI